ncbi:branched-chain amino acid ABC transporter substrate-binding protein [Halobiforma lacisalsi AJ5]|uniref:Branched-chain amino acid ABC transporter substrate-binding protein n=1 Tax=Natronobacterium lacisalsi AJ5 TaxID=358396 RepID=M0LDP1_NATLA|nr:ABC transporter substrate-binding protein [Halobiforma lacisalsi]APW99113.1 branched-chain amino acid ABC transporter substrate-binding protein [Halobiforma lacisalsi AJ5]EMA31233.1 branched-chain amino acid ABC transporter substrate-binding protein [Halobiforma lacisalsi AJ5]
MGYNTTRRGALKRTGALTAVGLGGLAGCLDEQGGQAGGDPEDETITIGALQPVSGELEYYGQISLMGFYSGLAYKYGVDPIEDMTTGSYELDPDDGPTFEIIVEDTEFNPETAQNVAESLVVDEDVDLLFGGSSSDSARRIIPNVVDEADVPYIIGPAADGDITVSSEHCHDLAFRASEHTAMDARAGGRYVAEQGDVSTVAIFAAEGAFGEGVANNYQEVLENQGVEVLEPRFVEAGYSEFEGMFDEAVEQGADGVVGGFTFITLPEFLPTAMSYDEIQAFGGFAALVTTQITGQTVEAVLGEDFTAEDIQDAGLGPFTTRYHWNQYDNPINDEFVDLHIDAYDQVPDLFSAGTFVGASALVQAIEESGSTEGEDIADAMHGMTVTDTPKGENAYTFQEHNNQAASAMTVAWPVPTSEEYEDTWDAAVMPGEPVETYAAEEVVVPAEEASCDLG